MHVSSGLFSESCSTLFMSIGCRAAGRNAAIERARRRNSAQANQSAARGSKVTLMRKYRTGELPDIEKITVESFIAPLGEWEPATITSVLSCQFLCKHQLKPQSQLTGVNEQFLSAAWCLLHEARRSASS